MSEWKAAFIAIGCVSIFFGVIIAIGYSVSAAHVWEARNCPDINAQEAGETRWTDVRRCSGYG